MYVDQRAHWLREVFITSSYLLMNSINVNLCILENTNYNPMKEFKDLNNEVENQIGKNIKTFG
jgi:hypothetical protein